MVPYSPRPYRSGRPALAALLAVVSPTVGWAEESVNRLRLDPPAAASESLRRPVDLVEHTELVPLPQELSPSYGSAIPLISPISRSAGDFDDRWVPRGELAKIVGNTLQSIRDLPSRSRDQQPADSAAEPKTAEPQTAESQTDVPLSLSAADVAELSIEHEPSQELALDSPSLNAPESAEPADDRVADVAEAAESSSASDSVSTGESDKSGEFAEAADAAATRDANSAMEIRKLKLSPHGRGEAAEPARQLKTAKTVAGKGVTVGDLQRPEYPNPIHGDRITDSGELILATGRAAANLPILAQTARLKPVIQRGLHYYWDNPEDAAERTHWGMMHAVMVFDRDTHIVANRRRFNAVAWMAGNNPCRNQLLFGDDRDGIVVKTGVGVQGHQGQLLAIFGQINVPKNYPLYSPQNQYTVENVLHREMRDCRTKTELTFTLIALAHYADSDTSWVSGDGQRWSVERLIQEELDQPVVGSACGGTHRLMGFAHALRRRRAEEKPITGQWDRAERYLADFDRYIWTLQNRDGSMSTAWFEQPQDNGDLDRKIQTTGHILELLMLTTPDAELQSPKMLRTVGFLANALHNERGRRWQVGPKGHALRSVAMYYQRVFGDATPWRAGEALESAGRSPSRAVR